MAESDCFWKITRDTGNTGEYAADNRRGTTGPRGGNPKLPTPIYFRMVTDDWPEDRCAYYGRAANDESLEYALLGFGAPDYGMTAVHVYVRKGEPCPQREFCIDTSGKAHWEVYIG